MASISLPTGSYALPEPRASVRRLVNCFSELAPIISQDDDKNKDTPVILRRAPGIVSWATDGTTNPCRGLWMMQGTLYTVIGPNLYSIDANANLALLGTGIPGNSIVKMSDNGDCLVIIIPNTNLGYTYITNPVITNYTMTVGNITPPASTYTGTLTAGFAGSPPILIGYNANQVGALSSTTWGNETIESLYSNTQNGTTVFNVSGFGSDPSQSYFSTIQVGTTTFNALNATYSYTGGTSSWIWSGQLDATNNQQLAVTITPLPTPVGGATGGTLNVTWPYVTQQATITFSDGETRSATFTQNNAQVAWLVALTGSPQGITQIQFQSSFAPIYDPTFVQFGAQNLGFIDTYIVFLANNGREFYNCDSQTVSSNGPITFSGASEFPREYGTDLFVGMIIDHRQIYMLGQLTSEVYIDAGNTVGSPFASAPNNFMQMGCDAGLTIAQQNQTVFWLANDRTVRQMNGIYPTRISNSGIEAILEQADIAGAFAFSYSIAGHLFYVLTIPNDARTLVFDCLTGEWHELSSAGLGYWRPYCSVNAYGMWLLGDSQSGTIGYADTSVFTEYGAIRTATWIHQPIYSGHNRIRHLRLEIVMGTGTAPLGINPLLTLQISDDGGNSYRTMPTISLGLTGKYLTRAQWWRLGMARDRVYQFNLSDPVESWVTDVQLETAQALH